VSHCNQDCNQGDDCPARKGQGFCSGVHDASFNLGVPMSHWESISFWATVAIACVCSVVVAAGAMGFAYSKWIA
jgi:hypothetical protein